PLILALSSFWSVSVPVAKAQGPGFENGGGEISGTVLLAADNRPAVQVVVSLKSDAIYRSILTDLEGRFVVRGLPAGAYNVVAEEAGYDPDGSIVQLDGASSSIVLHLRPAMPPHDVRNAATVSVRQLRIPGKAMGEYQRGLQSIVKHDLTDALKHFTKAST